MTESTKSLYSYQVTIFTTLFIGYGIYSYNRKSVAFALPQMMAEGLDKSGAGLIASSQNLAYAISKFIGGILSDRISARLLFTGGLFLSGLVTLLFANFDSLLIWTLLWFLNGFAQGAGWPACAKLLQQWYAPAQFGTWWSLLSASGNITGALSPFLANYIVTNFGWRVSVVIAGTVSLFTSIFALMTLINSPTNVGFESFCETEKKAEEEHEDGLKLNRKDIFTDEYVLLLSFCYLTAFCAKTSVVDWGQLYLIDDRNLNTLLASAFISSLEIGGCIGGIIAGWLTDVAVKSKFKLVGNKRMPVALLFTFGSTICLHLMYFNVSQASSNLFIASLGFGLGASLYGPIAIYGICASEAAPGHLSGTAHAVVALAGNIGAVVAGLPFSYIAKRYNWSAIFLLLEFMIGSTVLVMLLYRKSNSSLIKPKVD